MASTVEPVQTQKLVLRRCARCNKINRVHVKHILAARCGVCSRELTLSHYDVLGLHQNATSEEIRKAFHRSVLQWHPDKHPGDDSADRQFQRVMTAYYTLKHPTQRASYDISQLTRIHIQLQQRDTDSERQPTHTNSKADSQSSAAKNPRRNSSRSETDATMNSTKETLHLLTTTSIMLAGVSAWAFFNSSSGHTNPLFLLIAVATGVYGVGKFLFVLSEH